MFWGFSSTHTNSQSCCPWTLTPDHSPDLPRSARHTIISSCSHCRATYCPAPKTAPLSFSLSCMQPGLPISPAHPTAHVHMEGLSGWWRFLHGRRGGLKEVKKESFTAVIAPLYVVNHWGIIICEKYIYIKNPLLQPYLPHRLCKEAQGEKWGGKAWGSGLCSEALWNTPGDVWLTFLDGRWPEG